MSADAPIFARFAPLYDAAYAARGKDYRAEAEAVLAAARAVGASPRTVLDLGCGSGAHLEHLVRAGLHGTGVDASAAMLAAARARVPDAELHLGDMRTCALPARFDLVTCLFAAIGYLPDRAALSDAVAAAAAMLADGGAIAIEPSVFPDALAAPTRDVLDFACDGRAWRRVTTAERTEDDEGVVLRIRFEFTALDGGDAFVETHPIRLFTRADYRAACDAAGLRGDLVAAPPFPRGLVVARR